MSDQNETGKGGKDKTTEIIEEAKKEAEKKVDAAKSDDEKRKAGEEVNRDLREAKSRVQTIIETIKDQPQVNKIMILRGDDDAQNALRNLTKAIRLIQIEKQKFGQPGIISSQIATAPQGLPVLEKIAEQPLNIATAAAIEYFFGDFIFGDKEIIRGGQITEEAAESFKRLADFDPIAAERIKNAIKKASEEGKISGLTAEEVEEKLRVEKIEEVGKTGKNNYITVEEEDEWNLLFKKIGSKINEKIFDLEDDERKVVFLFQWGGDLGKTKEEKEAFERAISKLGIDRYDVNRYLFLRQKFTNLPLELIKNYAGAYRNILERAEKDFNIKNLIQIFVNEKGEIDPSNTKARKNLKKLINKYYFKVLHEIHSNKSMDFHQAMRENQSYQYFFSGLSQIIFQACDELERSLPKEVFQDDKGVIDEKKKRDFIFFLTDVKTRFQSSIMTYANIMHNLPLWARGGPATFEKWSQFMGNLFHSELAEVFDDDGFMDLARRVVTTVIRREIVKNGNQYPSDLMSGNYDQEGVRWSQKFESLIRDELEQVAQKIGMNLEEDQWEIERALVYSPAIGIDTLIDIETMATADPKWADFKGVHPLLQVVSAKFNWGLGRGDIYADKIARYLLGMEVSLFPEKRKIPRLWSKKKWAPKKFADFIDRQVRKYGDEVMGKLFTAGGLYQELLNMLSIAVSLISRHGWRMEGIYEEFSSFDKVKKIRQNVSLGDFWKKDDVWKVENWQQLWDEAIRQYGTASLWWFLTSGPSRLSQEMKRLVAKQKGEEEVNINFIEWMPTVYRPTNKMLEEVFAFRVGDEVKKMSLLEIRQIRMNQLRGELFFRYLRRDPGNFFLLLNQMAPQLSAKSNELFDDIINQVGDQKNKEAVIKAIKNYKADRIKKEQLLSEFNNLYSKWGDFIFSLSDIRNFLREKTDGFKETTNFIDLLVNQSSVALHKAIKRGDIFVSKDDFTDKKVKEFIFGADGKKGLIELTTNLSQDRVDDFYQNFGDYDHFGKDNFFYRMANAWFIKELDINPFSADVNHYAVFKHIGKGGEDVFTRLHGDTLTVFQESIKQLAGLSNVLLEVTKTGDMEKIYEVHKSLYKALSGAMGQEYAQRANYILAQIVTKFFLEHSLARDPKLNYLFPLNLFFRLGLDKNISLSKIVTEDLGAHSMDTNALREYFATLAHRSDLGVIPVDGAWSEKHLQKVFDATKEQFIVGDVVPKFLWFFILFLIAVYIKKAIKEIEEKKK